MVEIEPCRQARIHRAGQLHDPAPFRRERLPRSLHETDCGDCSESTGSDPASSAAAQHKTQHANDDEGGDPQPYVYAQHTGVPVERVLVVQRDAFCGQRDDYHGQPVQPALCDSSEEFHGRTGNRATTGMILEAADRLRRRPRRKRGLRGRIAWRLLSFCVERSAGGSRNRAGDALHEFSGTDRAHDLTELLRVDQAGNIYEYCFAAIGDHYGDA